MWRLKRNRWGIAVLALGSLLLTILGGAGTSLLLTIVALSLVVVGFGLRAGIVTTVLYSLALIPIMFRPGRSFGHALVELLGTFVILQMGNLIGQILVELQQERVLNRQLVDETKRAAITEQELMLADERSRSARELHDGLGHQLTLVVLGLEYAQRVKDKDPQKAFDEVSRAHETASDALAYMRKWVRALNPPRESELRGTKAFDAIADSFRGTGLNVTVTSVGEEHELGRASSLFALRMVQEGLTNVLRHSSAENVRLDLAWSNLALAITLADDGSPAELKDGFGLRSLAERADQIGGSFSATSTPTGVVLSAEIPLDDSHQQGESK